MFVTNPKRRCQYCKGREVLLIDAEREEVTSSSLSHIGNDTYRCVNTKECSANVKAENEKVTMGTDKQGKINYWCIEEDGKVLLEARKNEVSK